MLDALDGVCNEVMSVEVSIADTHDAQSTVAMTGGLGDGIAG